MSDKPKPSGINLALPSSPSDALFQFLNTLALIALERVRNARPEDHAKYWDRLDRIGRIGDRLMDRIEALFGDEPKP
jgi:hypothetical protein